MDWAEFFNWLLTAGLAGLASLFAWYIKFKVPKDDARRQAAFEQQLKNREKELTAKLNSDHDIREYKQQTENVAIDILQEMIKEKGLGETEMRRIIDYQGRMLKNLAVNIRTLAGVIQEKLEASDGKNARKLP